VYEEDPVFQVQPRVVEFQVGEHPLLPLEGHKFLCFSFKVSGSLTAAEPYIRQVYRLARKPFDQQVRFWHELMMTLEIMTGEGPFEIQFKGAIKYIVLCSAREENQEFSSRDA